MFLFMTRSENGKGSGEANRAEASSGEEGHSKGSGGEESNIGEGK